jgi:hypothetical protein
MHLTKAQRIGVIASLAWAIAAYLVITRIDYHRAALEVETTRALCSNLQASTNSNVPRCEAEEAKTWNNWTNETVLKGLAVAILPIPFGWLFADFVVWLREQRRSRSADPDKK